jgi:hypothetical protein
MEGFDTIESAKDYLAAGFSVFPILPDGEKRPALRWIRFRDAKWEGDNFSLFEGHGIAIVCGAISNLEVIDFDYPKAYEEFCEIIEKIYPGGIHEIPVIRTPKGYGYHLYLKRRSPAKGRKLAMRPKDGGADTVIEIRGEGHYVLAPGGNPEAHAIGKPYEQISGPPLSTWPLLDFLPDEIYDRLIEAARALDRRPKKEIGGQLQAGNSEKKVADYLLSKRPGDDFNERGDWSFLERAGWTITRERGDVIYWCRPGKDRGVSATTGHCVSDAGDLFYVFSTSAAPFENEVSYSRFAALAICEHGGDFFEATKRLVADGYGEESRTADRDGLRQAVEKALRDIGAAKETPKAVLDAAENMRDLKRLLSKSRHDLLSGDPDQDLLTATSAFASWAVRCRWTLREFLEALSAWHGSDLRASCLSVDEITGRIAYAIENRLADVTGAAGYEDRQIREGATNGGDVRRKMLGQLSGLLGIKISKVYQTEIEDGLFGFIAEDPSGDELDIRIGGPGAILSTKSVQEKIFAAFGQLIPPSSKTKPQWQKVVTLIGCLREVVDPDFREKDGEAELLDAYFADCAVHIDSADESFTEKRQRLAAQGEPWVERSREKGGGYSRFLYASSLQEWIVRIRGIRITEGKVRNMLRRNSFSSKKVMGKGRKTKSYWCGVER